MPRLRSSSTACTWAESSAPSPVAARPAAASSETALERRQAASSVAPVRFARCEYGRSLRHCLAAPSAPRRQSVAPKRVLGRVLRCLRLRRLDGDLAAAVLAGG